MGKKKKSVVELIAMKCGICKSKNYSTQKNRRNTPGKLELNKFCRFCRKHTGHSEAKIK